MMTALPLPRRRFAEPAGALLGSVFVMAALVIIWVARLEQGRDLYVSELGATGQPTAHWFEGALLLIVAGGSIIAYAARGIRSRGPLLSLWAPAVSLWIGCGFFLIASQIPCTSGCPLPVGASFTWQDLIHTVVAVLAFAAACLGMLQMSFAVGYRPLARLSLGAGVAVALIAGTGGILSLARFQTDFGSRLELAATTIALGWLLTLGVMMALRPVKFAGVMPLAEPEVALPVV